LETRLQEHRNKTISNAFTAKTDDWELFFSIQNLEYKQARRMEAHLKNMKSKSYIVNLKKYPELTDKLTDKYK
jgi:putative endonuclease